MKTRHLPPLLPLLLWSALPAQAQTVNATGNVNPFPNPNPTPTWDVVGNLSVGDTGAGTLTIEAGGTVTSEHGGIGFAAGSTGEVTVTGANSHWLNETRFGGSLIIGRVGTGTLRVENGGAVTSGVDGTIGAFAGSIGEVTVTGANSLWQNFYFFVGNEGTGTLKVEDGGTVISGLSVIGHTTSGTGEVTVTGANSHWQAAVNSSAFMIGRHGTGTLTVEDGGRVTVHAATTLATEGNSRGTLNLNGTPGSRGVLETSSIREDSGALGGKINFDGGLLRADQTQPDFIQNFEPGDVELLSGGAFIDTNGSNIGISAVLTGVGGLTKLGEGTLTLAGAQAYTGVTTVEAGSLRITGSLDGSVTAQAGATLTGNGAIHGQVTMNSGASLSPGSSPGTLSTGSETWEGGASYIWEINSPNGTAGTAWDVVDITGNLELLASPLDPIILEIHSLTAGNATGPLAGFNPSTSGYIWEIARFDSISGFAPSAFFIDTTHFLNDLDGGHFSLSQTGNSLYLNFTAIPEPSLSLLVLGGLLVPLRRRGR